MPTVMYDIGLATSWHFELQKIDNLLQLPINPTPVMLKHSYILTY